MPVALITGATDGLGRHVARDLAGDGWTVLVHGRSRERVEETLAEVPGGRPYLADLAALEEVRRLADDVLASEERLDVLVNNAGVGAGPPGGEREESADGLELRLAVNHLAHFRLTLALLPLIGRRIVNVASIGQYPLDLDDLQFERGWDGTRAYRKSKLAQILFTFSLAERLDGGVTVNALHPATLMDTTMVHEWRRDVRSTVEEGARATERLIADPALDRVSGRFFNGMDEERANEQAYDPEARERLWTLSESLTS